MTTAVGGRFPDTFGSSFAFMHLFESTYGKERMNQIQEKLWKDAKSLSLELG